MHVNAREVRLRGHTRCTGVTTLGRAAQTCCMRVMPPGVKQTLGSQSAVRAHVSKRTSATSAQPKERSPSLAPLNFL